jgi:hypothetical protein
MKKIVEHEVTVCDICGKESWCETCLGCGKDYCHECAKIHGKEYNHEVFFAGSGDGFYCNECDKTLTFCPSCPGAKLHTAYVIIKNLRNEYNGYSTTFKIRSDEAEKNLEKLRGKR